MLSALAFWRKPEPKASSQPWFFRVGYDRETGWWSYTRYQSGKVDKVISEKICLTDTQVYQIFEDGTP